MRGLAFFCCLSAAIYALIGMGLGMHMAAGHDYLLAPAHAHLNLLGWVSMAIYGLFYHSVPRSAASLPAKIHVAIATIGLWIMIPGIAIAITGGTEAFAIIGSLLTILGMALFAVIIILSRRNLA